MLLARAYNADSRQLFVLTPALPAGGRKTVGHRSGCSWCSHSSTGALENMVGCGGPTRHALQAQRGPGTRSGPLWNRWWLWGSSFYAHVAKAPKSRANRRSQSTLELSPGTGSEPEPVSPCSNPVPLSPSAPAGRSVSAPGGSPPSPADEGDADEGLGGVTGRQVLRGPLSHRAQGPAGPEGAGASQSQRSLAG